MELRAQRRIAAAVLKVGKNNIWIDPDFSYDVSLALTRDDIRKLIYDRVIQSRSMKGVSRARARIRLAEKRRGQHRGHGSRHGTANARRGGRKNDWMRKIRAQRRYLKALRDEELITRAHYRELYAKTKGGAFRSVTHLRHTITELGWLKKKKKRVRL
ncbi:MAG: 50S ribosomal protein L19e [Candidatus Hodarchaeales archaeon]|jgi:large subunit ribosomal protein L19e